MEGVYFHASTRKIVVKIGSSTIVNAERRFNFKVAEALAEDIAKLKRAGKEVLLVSSGAIALGKNGHGELDKKVAAAKGQVALMAGWREVFAMHGIDVCQVLVSNGCNIDFDALSIENLQVVINGNDVIEETNNDLVASKVAKSARADLLVLLTNVDGYLNNSGSRVSIMDAFRATDEGTVISDFGTGGITTKLQAIRDITCAAVIANGTEHLVLSRILAGEDIGTLFMRGR